METEEMRPPATWIARFQLDPRLHNRLKTLVRSKKTTMRYLLPELLERGMDSIEEQMYNEGRRQ